MHKLLLAAALCAVCAPAHATTCRASHYRHGAARAIGMGGTETVEVR